MLITCPECERKISDKALICPGCGFPVNEIQYTTSQATKIAKKRSGKKKMRLPNGFGRITEIKNKNLRNPFRVMVTVGVDNNGKPIGKLLKPKAYFKTYNEAYQALMDYNKDPFDLSNEITLESLYNSWLPEYEKTVTASRYAGIKSAWQFSGKIRSLNIRSIKPSHVKEAIENGEKIDKYGKTVKIHDSMKVILKSIFIALFDYAIEKDYIDKNPAKLVKNSKTKQKQEEKEPIHSSYTDEEVNIFLNNLNNVVGKFVIVQCYSGWRPSELLNLEMENIDIDNWIFVGGMKTANGKNRVVPIHSRIQDIIKELYNEAKNNSSKYLFGRSKDLPISYSTFKKKYASFCKNTGIPKSHKPHDGRVTFVTKAKKYGVDEYAIKRLVGHSIPDLTERIYTERSIEWLREQIEKIK